MSSGTAESTKRRLIELLTDSLKGLYSNLEDKNLSISTPTVSKRPNDGKLTLHQRLELKQQKARTKIQKTVVNDPETKLREDVTLIVQCYLEEGHKEPDFEPLDYWKVRSTDPSPIWKKMSDLAEVYLTPPCATIGK